MDLKQALKDWWSAETPAIEQEVWAQIKETVSTMGIEQANRIYVEAFADYFGKKQAVLM
ncbi:hypothetical protein [Bacteroides sp.]|uniref:hypothetical protein n=1 Tax=Bacteroides sp. TaxID=29523 RepID=UPI002628DE70|nr:hypothetical protein [Bacteroides sp.]MDD3040433.1 hypothetical protein [Bacteroides sp.]